MKRERQFELHDCVVKFLVDYDHEELMQHVDGTIHFWDTEARVKSNLDDIQEEYNYTIEDAKVHLFLLDATVKLLQLSNDWTVEGFKDEIVRCEGWPPLNGEMGITLLSCNNFNFSRDDVLFYEED